MATLSLSPHWLSRLTSILAENKKSTIYALATIEADKSTSIPRVRHLVHRNILTSHPARPVLIASTDIRTPKVHQLRSHPDTKGPNSELAWWIAPASVQFRISARTHVLPAPSHELYSRFPLQDLSSSGGGDSGPDSPETSEDWEKLRIRTFNALPPFLRASFVRPIPGTPLPNPGDANNWPTTLPESGKEESEEEKRLVREALGNFALVLLEPLEVDLVELGVEPNRRTQWKSSGGEWTEQGVVP